MRQIDLLRVCMRMKEGQAITLSKNDMLEAAEGSIKSLLFDGPARQSDVDELVCRIQDNWDVDVFHDILKDTYTIRKKQIRKPCFGVYSGVSACVEDEHGDLIDYDEWFDKLEPGEISSDLKYLVETRIENG